MATTFQASVKDKIYQETQKRFSKFHDPAHGWEHVKRVYELAEKIGKQEGADLFIVGVAALLHDIGRLVQRKGKPHAEVSVEEARPLLQSHSVGEQETEAILHAIAAHSYSHGLQPLTLEARVVSDADRLDGLGAIGIMRWAISGTIKRKAKTQLYHPEDPFDEWHQPDDRLYMLDHFYTKLLKLESGMYTETGRALAQRRSEYMRAYLQEFRAELEL